MTDVDWQLLTRLPRKAEAYAAETYFREGWDAFCRTFGERAPEFLRETALLVVKPDGVLTGKLLPVQDFLSARGFDIVAVQWLTYSRHLWQALWRYQLTSATLDRLAVNELVLNGPGLMLLLHDREPAGVPATVRLSGLKGPADVSRQLPGSLRSVLAQPNRVLSLVHVADEPADLVREIGLLLERRERARVLASLVTGRLSDGDTEVLAAARRDAASPPRDLDVAAARERAVAAVRSARAAGAAGDAVAERALAYLDRMARGERIPWREFAACLDELGAELDRWDAALLGTTYISYDEPGRRKLIENVDAALWT